MTENGGWYVCCIMLSELRRKREQPEKRKENNNRLSSFNDIEIQIYWKNDLATTMEINNAPELAGSILDITVSTDNTLNSAKYNAIEEPDINALATSNNEPITTHDESIIEVNS